MKTASLAWRAGVATDPGRQRKVNEDRVLVDESRGIFLVVDGLGGHAAGEMAAEIAVRAISEHLAHGQGDLEAAIRQAITAANNEICEVAQSHPEWLGMACVLTLVIAHEDQITVGHVGDSRLYLVWNGNLRKLTADHSPVGELEDSGELTEREAMRHPRRNEVFRDVGSEKRTPDQPQFIDVKTFPFRPDAALLLCTDGLSDVLASAEIKAIIERYDGDPNSTAKELVGAANEAGGKDNISVVFVAGPEFLGSDSSALTDVRPRHSVTRNREDTARWRAVLSALLWVAAGIAIGVSLWVAYERFGWRDPAARSRNAVRPTRSTRIAVNPANARSIIEDLTMARPGDTLEVPPGEYLGPIQLKRNVNIIAMVPGRAVIRSDPASVTDPGIAIAAHGVQNGRIAGLRIAADDTHPLRTGILIDNSSIAVEDADVSGTIESGIRIADNSQGILLGNFVHENAGAGIVIDNQSAPRLVGNWVVDNGRVRKGLRAGIEIGVDAKPVLERNVILRNGLSTLGAITPEFENDIRRDNLMDGNPRHGFEKAKP